MGSPRYQEPDGWGKKKPGIPEFVTSEEMIKRADEIFGKPDPAAPKLPKSIADSVLESVKSFPPPVGIEITHDFRRGFNAATQALEAVLSLGVKYGLKSCVESDDEKEVLLGERTHEEADEFLERLAGQISYSLPRESVFGCAITDSSGHVFIISNSDPVALSNLLAEASKKIRDRKTDIKDFCDQGQDSEKTKETNTEPKEDWDSLWESQDEDL